jgi:hypothetical protein
MVDIGGRLWISAEGYRDGDPGDGEDKIAWFEDRRDVVVSEHLDGCTKLRAFAAG